MPITAHSNLSLYAVPAAYSLAFLPQYVLFHSHLLPSIALGLTILPVCCVSCSVVKLF